ncbi:MAG: MBL fold metallo-hydrolase [Promethearchaeota archaeon]
MSEEKAIQINEGIYWIGFGDPNAGFSNNPYLIIEGDSVIVIDPGSRREDHFSIVKRKIESIIPIEKITHIIVHHQDPDLCASIPLFEDIIGRDNFELITTLRTALLIPYYGIYTEITSIEDGDILELDNGRELMFITAPYLHFAGSFTTYDTKVKVLFSSDIFAAFSTDWELYANENYIEAMRIFHEPYLAHKDPILSYINKLKDLEIDMICPQHGSIINKDIGKYVEALKSFEVGTWL